MQPNHSFSSTMPWDLDLRAELYKDEFFRTPRWLNGNARDRMVARWQTSTTEELAELLRLQESERPAHLGSIIREQRGDVLLGYWYECLRFDPKDRPATDELLHATLHLAGSVAMHFKERFNRVRPWVLEPRLSPPLSALPGHPAYPSGLSTQMHLMAATALHLLSDEEPLSGAEKEVRTRTQTRIADIARDVARNRERAGLHYRSDTVAGEQLAAEIFRILRTECRLFQETLKVAKDESKTAAVY